MLLRFELEWTKFGLEPRTPSLFNATGSKVAQFPGHRIYLEQFVAMWTTNSTAHLTISRSREYMLVIPALR